jgi:probable addiction module antidote protein
MPKRTADYREGLLEDLLNSQEAAFYVEAALDESNELFLRALRDVAESRQMSKVAKEAGVAREALYRMLSETGNPTLTSLSAILSSVGLRIRIEALDKSPTAALTGGAIQAEEVTIPSKINQLDLDMVHTSTFLTGGFWEFAGHTGGLVTNRLSEIRSQTLTVCMDPEKMFRQIVQQTRPQ